MREDIIHVFGLLFVYLNPADILSLRVICKTFLSSFKSQFKETLESEAEGKLISSFCRRKRLNNHDSLLLEEASKRGFLKLSRSLLKNGIKCSRIVIRNCCMSETDLEAASQSGNLDAVILLHEKYNVPCSSHSLAVAIINKHLEVAIYLHETVGVTLLTSPSPPPLSWPCFAACRQPLLTQLAISLSLTCPCWMVDHALSLGCDPFCFVGKGKVPSADIVRDMCRVESEKMEKSGIEREREKGKREEEREEKREKWEIVKLLCECEAVLDEWAVTYICKGGDISTIEFVFEKGAKPIDDVADHAAGWGMEVLQFLHSKGYNSTPHGMTVAAEQGSLDIVKYLHSITVDGAIINKRREVALFLYSQGGACSSGLLRFAASQSRSDIFELLGELKQPIPHPSARTSRKYRRHEIFSFTSPSLSFFPPPPSPTQSPVQIHTNKRKSAIEEREREREREKEEDDGEMGNRCIVQ